MEAVSVKYMRKDTPDEYGIKELQDVLLEIMVYIDSFCNEHGVDYCLMAGSALGARRHEGFIPWDDDIDIYMTEDDYDRFRNAFLQNGDKEHFYLQEWGKTEYRGKHMVTMAKIRMNGTALNEVALEGMRIHQGVFVDIFILHKCADRPVGQKKQYFWTEAVVLKGLQKRGYKPKGFKDRVLLTASKLIPTKWMLKHGLYNAYKYQNADTNTYHGFVDTRSFSRAVFSKDIMFPTKYVDFETIRLKVPGGLDKYLEIQFGSDYMTPPPVEKRPINKHTVGWSRNAVSSETDYSDESVLI